MYRLGVADRNATPAGSGDCWIPSMNGVHQNRARPTEIAYNQFRSSMLINWTLALGAVNALGVIRC